MDANQSKIELTLSQVQKEQLTAKFGEQLAEKVKGVTVEKVNEKIVASLRVN